jgi:SAM-dependent methyltransferase
MDPTADQSAFWDQAATSKVFTHPLDYSRLTRALSQDASILDYGCGQGRLCRELAQAGYHSVHGVDSSPEMIRIARSRYGDLRFSVVDDCAVPFADASFDAVLLFAVLTCIPSNARQQRLIAELVRVLRPGGLLLISDYPLQQDERNRRRYESFREEFGVYGTFRLSDGAVVRHHAMDWFGELLADLRIVDRVEIDATTMNGNPARVVQLWAAKAAPVAPPAVRCDRLGIPPER